MLSWFKLIGKTKEFAGKGPKLREFLDNTSKPHTTKPLTSSFGDHNLVMFKD